MTFEMLFDFSHLHFIGIGGVSMSALAAYFAQKGMKVTGGDAVRGDFCDMLASNGVKVGVPSGINLMNGCDAVVVNAAIREGNAELTHAETLGVPILKREQVLGAVFDNFAKNVAVCGTHGKTTTAAMITSCLSAAGKDPTAFVGGVMKNFDSNFLSGGGEFCVAEACEYKAGFLQLHPLVNCMLNVDGDHLDYFKDVNAVAQAFAAFAKNTRGTNVICGDDPVLKTFDGVTFGLGKGNRCTAENIVEKNGSYSFDVKKDGKRRCRISLQVAGRHNVVNALGAFCSLEALGVSDDDVQKGLDSFKGVARRLEITKGLFDVVADYAHHPREIAAVLSTIGQMGYEKTRLVFQPHTYTRTRGLFGDFVEVLQADEIYVLPTFAAREDPIKGFESVDLAAALKARGKTVFYFDNFAEAAEALNKKCKKNDVVLLVGAGDVDKMRNLLKN